MNAERLTISKESTRDFPSTRRLAGSREKAQGWKGVSFADLFQGAVRKERTEKAGCCCKGKEPFTGVQEPEDKYCSLCGSRIKEDGTCPICIVPFFISGNPSSGSQTSKSQGVQQRGVCTASRAGSARRSEF